jgi:hypothetical protein
MERPLELVSLGICLHNTVWVCVCVWVGEWGGRRFKGRPNQNKRQRERYKVCSCA